MGRKKPGKPRRPRKRAHTLRELQPPGEGYEEWISVRPGIDPSRIDDPRVGAGALEMMQRLAVLGPLYDGLVPKAALYLDDMIDQGRLPVFRGKDEGNLVPIKEIAAFCQDQGSVRESIHNLHAIGALLVFIDEEHSAPYIRMVTKRPEPGQPWQFNGDSDVAVSTVCVPSHIWEELPLDVAAAVGFMRACRSQLEKPDPVVYGRHAGVNGAEHARELFAAAEASGYVDYKGCDACPAGHLCTRP